MLDRGMLVFVEVKLDRTTPDVFDAFADAVQKSDDVMECHMVAGGFDYLVKARVSGMEAYRSFLSDVISVPSRRSRNPHIPCHGRSKKHRQAASLIEPLLHSY
jgi:Lrp/AsnC family leucine-responsive transcriptional regulator